MSKNRRQLKFAKRKAKSNPKVKYPFATLALYGPDDRIATKMVASIFRFEGDEDGPMKKWYVDKGDIRINRTIQNDMMAFLDSHNAKKIVAVDRIIGCPHEEGIDYPSGSPCPSCPFWANIDRWTGEEK